MNSDRKNLKKIRQVLQRPMRGLGTIHICQVYSCFPKRRDYAEGCHPPIYFKQSSCFCKGNMLRAFNFLSVGDFLSRSSRERESENKI